MSETTYSADEIKHLFQTLYNEKKRNKELLIKLQQQDALSKSNSTQQNDISELVDENNALQQQVITLKKQIEKVNQELKKEDPRHAELLHESLQRQNALEHELKQKIEEIDFIKSSQNEDFDTFSSNEEVQRLQNIVTVLEDELKQIKEENIHLKVVQSEVIQLKQALAQGIVDFKELSGIHQITLKERSEALSKSKQYVAQLENQRHEILRLQNYLSKGKGVNEQLQREVSQLKEMALKAEHAEDELTIAKDQNRSLNTELSTERQRYTQIDEELHTAQHHLAKKMKENALLEQKTVDIQQSLIEAQKTLTDNKMTITDLQSKLEEFKQQEFRLNEQLKEAGKAAETQIARSEEKIQTLTQKLTASEQRVRELEQIEEKQNRLQSLLTDAAALFPTSKVSENLLPTTPINEKQDKEKHFSDLFEISRPAQKHRRSLLE